MTQQVPILTLSVVATTAIARGRGVTFGGAQANATGQKVMGIAQHDAAIGETVAVVVCGSVIAESGAALAVGNTVAVDTQGRMVVAATLSVVAGATQVTSATANGAGIITGADSPIFAVGDVLQAATAAGQFVEILLRR
jgi:hypothetical protein